MMARRRPKTDVVSNFKNWLNGKFCFNALVSNGNKNNIHTAPWVGVEIDHFWGIARWDYAPQKAIEILPYEQVDWFFLESKSEFEYYFDFCDPDLENGN